MSDGVEIVSEVACFGGRQIVARHASRTLSCDMTFALYAPPQAADGPVPVLWWLSGLTCTHENAMTKAGFQRDAAALGIAVAYPDTSPRGAAVADADRIDLGQGAGFYVDATEAPWSAHYRMRSYVLDELPALLAGAFPIDPARQAISGHSMGGHGALTLALSTPGRFRSASAFAPIANPSASAWGREQLTAYLGPDEAAWAQADAARLLAERGAAEEILVDQGDADPFLDKLAPEALERAAEASGARLTLRRRAGYDHSYFFVASFAPEHFAWHAERLGS